MTASQAYADILTLPHYEPRRPRMARQDRAAQFAPFDALNGYSAAIREAAKTHTQAATAPDSVPFQELLAEIALAALPQ